MPSIRSVSTSIVGSVLASAVVSWALRRLLLAADQRAGDPSDTRAAVVVVIPIIVGNQWDLGTRRAPPPAQR